MGKTAPSVFAAIHVGSEYVAMQVVEYHSLEDYRIVDTMGRQVSLGEETFKTGSLRFESVNALCDLLKGFRRLGAEYGVRDYRLVATTAVREADNQHYIIDQIRIKTGFQVEVADMPQEIFYKYAALLRRVQLNRLVEAGEGILFVDISSGGLGFTLYRDGQLCYQQNLHIGVLRVKESFDKWQRDSAYFPQALTEYIYSTIEPVRRELGSSKIKYLVLAGTATRLLLAMLEREEEGPFTFVSLAEFYQLYEQVQDLNLPQVMQRFQFSEQKAEFVLPMLVLYKQILDLLSIEGIAIPQERFIDGISVLHIAEKTQHAWLRVLEEQTVSLARAIGEKYNHDAAHAARVEQVALAIFDAMTRQHGLEHRERLLLKVAAILHDIGKFVSLRKHYLYSRRLIESTDILGFSDRERLIMANVASYHSKGTPTNADRNFAQLSNDEKVVVAKLAAILRLADAVDRTHRQKTMQHDIQVRNNELIIRVKSQEDLSLEEWTFADKADFFENVFGFKAKLIRQVG